MTYPDLAPPWQRLQRLNLLGWLDRRLARMAHIMFYDWSTFG